MNPPSLCTPPSLLEAVADQNVPQNQLTTRPPFAPVNYRPGELTARWIKDLTEVRQLKKQWQALEANAMQRSICHEYNYLVPALNHLADDSVKLLVVENASDESESQSQLVGLMPIEFKKVSGMPMSGAEVWKHDQAFDTTPLLDRQLAAEAWQTACEFLAQEGVALLALDTVSAGPCFESVLKQVQQALKLTRFQKNYFQRAALQPVESAEAYRMLYFSKNTRKKIQKMQKGLAKLGEVTWTHNSTEGDWESLTDQFLRIEGCGWKGKNGTSLNSTPETEAFFRELVKKSAAEGKMRFLSLELDGTPIAMLCDIQSGPVVYSYKTGFDEDYRKFSPGRMCETKNVEYLHNGTVGVSDSCTSPESASLSSIWGQKLDYQSVVFGLKAGVSNYVVKALPAAQAAARKVRRFNAAKNQMADRPRSVSCSVVDSVEGFAALEEIWNELNIEPMNGFDWNFTWWDSFKSAGQLHIIKFERAGSVIGIAPLYIDRWFGLERVRFIGSGKTCTEYVDIITHAEDRDLLDDILLSHLKEQTFSVVELECTRGDRLANRLTHRLSQQYRCDNRLVEPSWGFSLPDNWDTFVAASGKSLRRKIRKAEKRIKSREVHFSSTANGASVKIHFDILRDLHQERFHSKNKPGAFADKEFETFLRNALERLCAQKRAEIVVLYKGDEPIGAQLFLNSQHGYQFYQSGYATSHMKLEPGHIMFTYMVQRAINRGDAYFDFLRGDEPYKKFWGASPLALRKQRLVSKRLLPQLVSSGVATSRAVVALVKKYLKKG